jgi:hypothetical protein
MEWILLDMLTGGHRNILSDGYFVFEILVIVECYSPESGTV